MNELRKIKRALISVSDKSGLVEFVAELVKHGVELISTGGTAAHIRNSGFTVTDVSDVTGFPEMMDGRVKTLHPKIHGAFLALRDNADHVASMTAHGITPIDLVVVNLYPFEATIAKADVTLEEAVENIDIGGPAMIRSASKNWRDVAVVTDADMYGDIVEEMNANGGSLSFETRQRLAVAAYSRTAMYDMTIAGYLGQQIFGGDESTSQEADEAANVLNVASGSVDLNEGAFANNIVISAAKVNDLRYGENPHQMAALYTNGPDGIANAEQLHGKEMSFNNYVDADAAWALVNDFDETAVAIIKHTNPSGVGIDTTLLEAYKRALSTDPVSAFGGIVALNRKVDAETAAAIIEVFSEVIIAPEYDEDALELFKGKKNLRVLRSKDQESKTEDHRLEYKQISGGFLVQDADVHRLSVDELNIVTDRQPTDDDLKAMQLAWTVCKHVKSNAIVFANGERTLGVGAGQMNRVDSVRIAAMRAERFDLDLAGCALASDAFFPFRDNVDEAARFGVKAIIQPGGSIKDDESIAAANEHGITMAFTGIRHFKH